MEHNCWLGRVSNQTALGTLRLFVPILLATQVFPTSSIAHPCDYNPSSKMWRLIVMVSVLMIMSLVNVAIMSWFLYRYAAILHEFNTLKIACLVLENVYLMYMIATFFRIDEA